MKRISFYRGTVTGPIESVESAEPERVVPDLARLDAPDPDTLRVSRGPLGAQDPGDRYGRVAGAESRPEGPNPRAKPSGSAKPDEVRRVRARAPCGGRGASPPPLSPPARDAPAEPPFTDGPLTSESGTKDWNRIGHLGTTSIETLGARMGTQRGVRLVSYIAEGDGWAEKESRGPGAWSVNLANRLLDGNVRG